MTTRRRWAWIAAAVAVGTALLVGAGALLQSPSPQAPPSARELAQTAAQTAAQATEQAAAQAAAGQRLPWQVDVQADGTSRVMGLHLGADKLAQVRARTGDGLQVALVAQLGEVGVLEALAEPFHAGFVAGRLVLSFDVTAATLNRWRDNSTGSSPMEGGVRRFALRAADLAEAESAALTGLSFIPVARLNEADVRQRFGAPQSQRVLDGGATLLDYGSRGLTATVMPGQRALFQYVAPRDAARLGVAARGAVPAVLP